MRSNRERRTARYARGKRRRSKRGKKLKYPLSEEDKGWDWDAIVYIGTVLLNREEEEIWHMKPRKFFALLDQHRKFNTIESDDNTEDQGKGKIAFADQVF